MNRRSLLGALAGLAASSCARRHAGLQTLRVSAASAYPTLASFYLAQELGYFEAAGFRLEIIQNPHAPQVIPLLSGGNVDVAFNALSPAFFNAVARGARVRIVAGREIVTPGANDCALYGYRPSFPRGLANLKELRGKRISTRAKASVSEYWLDVVLARGGLTAPDVRVLFLDRAESIAAISQGKIDALLSASFGDRGFAAIEPRLVQSIHISDILPNSQFSHVLFGHKLLDGPAEVGGRFLAAYLRGVWSFAHGRNPKFLDDLAKASGWDVERAREAYRHTVPPGGAIDVPSLQHFADWAVQRGYCPPGVKVANSVDTRFLDEAHRLLPHRRQNNG